jgi:hypothetical protein
MRYGVVVNDKWTFDVEVFRLKTAPVLALLGATVLPDTANGDDVQCTSMCDLKYK